MAPKILIADDEPQLLAAYRDCFSVPESADDELAALGDALFSNAAEPAAAASNAFAAYRFDYVSQGEDAVERVRAGIAAGDPYAALFLDMRMPPGIDGLETARRVRELDKTINIVVVTGYSDHNPQKIARVAGPLDKLYYLSKPFRIADVQQLAQSLASKWQLEAELRRANQRLELSNIELQASEARARYTALHDQLTQLPNRVYLNDYLESHLRDRNRRLALVYLDLDHFKNVNDSLGHAAGDELIRQIGQRIRTALPAEAVVARLGGDEFAVALYDTDEKDALELAGKIVGLCTGEFEIMGARAFIGCSAGIAVSAAEPITLIELQRRADLALYAAKRAGRATCKLFDATLDDSAKLRSRIEVALRDALSAGALSLNYQPIIHPDNGQTYGYEALLRWTDPDLGSVPPAIFVPIAEQCGLAQPLGEWVISRALAEAAGWDGGVVSINISTLHFQSSELVDFVQKTAAQHGVPLHRIQFEITETAMFANSAQVAEMIVTLRKAGILVALDDFGTGYSSLVNLRDFEIDCIKIDKSFVDTLGKDRQASAIITSVTAMARLLGLNVVAEGVETGTQVQALRAMGCDLMQGYFYSQAMKPEELPYSNGAIDEKPDDQVGQAA
jgi:diguanylate cyclase (GGDEF)-like protein